MEVRIGKNHTPLKWEANFKELLLARDIVERWFYTDMDSERAPITEMAFILGTYEELLRYYDKHCGISKPNEDIQVSNLREQNAVDRLLGLESTSP